MITNIVVLSSLVLVGGFVIGWLLSPALRARIEQPKHQFQDALRRHDALGGAGAAGGEKTR